MEAEPARPKDMQLRLGWLHATMCSSWHYRWGLHAMGLGWAGCVPLFFQNCSLGSRAPLGQTGLLPPGAAPCWSTRSPIWKHRAGLAQWHMSPCSSQHSSWELWGAALHQAGLALCYQVWLLVLQPGAACHWAGLVLCLHMQLPAGVLGALCHGMEPARTDGARLPAAASTPVGSCAPSARELHIIGRGQAGSVLPHATPGTQLELCTAQGAT